MARLILFAVWLALSAGTVTPGDHVLIKFICKTGPSAVLMVEKLLWETPEKMPADCRLIPDIKPRNLAEVLEHFAWATAPDGSVAKVARVLREKYEHGYSAGFTYLLLM